MSANSAPAGRPIFSMRPTSRCAGATRAARTADSRSCARRRRSAPARPAMTETNDAIAVPATPSGWPVTQPNISIGASTMFSTTVADCMIIPGLKSPMPRSADPVATIANCSAIAGMNQARYSPASRAVSGSADCARVKRPRSAIITTKKTSAHHQRQHLRLIEDQARLVAILASGRVRDQRRRARRPASASAPAPGTSGSPTGSPPRPPTCRAGRRTRGRPGSRASGRPSRPA